MFPNAKVECARFKGTGTEEFLDQKSIIVHIGLHVHETFNFVLRHINKAANIEGVYTVSRWEYPVKAIREIIRNAIVHRDYSLTGKMLKLPYMMIWLRSQVLVFYHPLLIIRQWESRQSDARNKVIAPCV